MRPNSETLLYFGQLHRFSITRYYQGEDIIFPGVVFINIKNHLLTLLGSKTSSLRNGDKFKLVAPIRQLTEGNPAACISLKIGENSPLFKKLNGEAANTTPALLTDNRSKRARLNKHGFLDLLNLLRFLGWRSLRKN